MAYSLPASAAPRQSAQSKPVAGSHIVGLVAAFLSSIRQTTTDSPTASSDSVRAAGYARGSRIKEHKDGCRTFPFSARCSRCGNQSIAKPARLELEAQGWPATSAATAEPSWNSRTSPVLEAMLRQITDSRPTRALKARGSHASPPQRALDRPPGDGQTVAANRMLIPYRPASCRAQIARAVLTTRPSAYSLPAAMRRG